MGRVSEKRGNLARELVLGNWGRKGGVGRQKEGKGEAGTGGGARAGGAEGVRQDGAGDGA